MFAELIEKLMRHEDLTDRRGRRPRWRRSWKAARRQAQLAGLLVGLAMKGERPDEIVGLARTMRAHAVQLSRRVRRRCSTPAAPAAIGRARSTSRRARRWSSPPAASASPSTATARSRASSGSADVFEALGVRIAAPPAVVERCLAEARHRVLLRADVSSVDAARGARRAGSSACGPRSTCSDR